MNLIFLIVITVNISASFLFGFSLLIQKIYKDDQVKTQYLVMKVVLLFFLIPMLAFSFYTVLKGNDIRLIRISTDDFELAAIYPSEFGVLNFEKIFLLNHLTTGWLLIAILQLFLCYGASGHYMKKLMAHAVPLQEESVLEQLSECCRELGIKQQISFYFSADIDSPMLLGILRPCIFLDSSEYTEREIRFIIKHELLHLKHHDILFRIFAKAAQCMNWFNPVIYYFEIMFYDYGELVCDESVLLQADTDERKRYAHLILNLAIKKKKSMFGASMFCDTEKIMKRRLLHIMKGDWDKKRGLIVGMLACTYLVCFPAVTYAAGIGVLAVQRELVMEPIKEMRTIQTDLPEFRSERIKTFELSDAKISEIEIMRGSNTISVDIGKGEIYVFKTASLSSGDEVSFTLSVGSNNSFLAGVVDSKGTADLRNSSSGSLISSVSITKNGTYKIVIQNTSSNSIHVGGEILVE